MSDGSSDPWSEIMLWLDELRFDTFTLSVDLLLALAILVFLGFFYLRQQAGGRKTQAAIDRAQQAIDQTQQALTEQAARIDRVEQGIAQILDKLERDMAVLGEDVREARRIARAIPSQLERLQTGLSAAQDEILNQSAAKFQANEAIRAAITRGSAGNAPPAGKPPPAGKAGK